MTGRPPQSNDDLKRYVFLCWAVDLLCVLTVLLLLWWWWCAVFTEPSSRCAGPRVRRVREVRVG